ncbi:hypothetical protein W04_1442 [Pseudoalteromonas sp. SW0106-04]|uniref:DUF4856 domain-containing protein n=1 Tax=Pseudoalteromonas sp. SW0106-04 TaxID=1702169 RepID=UPI0006B644BB|nr:DUF4856 domain-containing protein [Pseudoalteromonas sp. SW0106-04]GAP74924.1 hypothetical protein W04_1442 [Pseudoalteromonas sp. SW0106-04]
MTLRKSLVASAVLAATLGLTGCGGSSDSSDNTTPEQPTNNPPTGISFLDESSVKDDVVGDEVGALSATDDADSGFTYTLSADEARFEIVDGNTLKLKDGIALNYEQQTEVSVNIKVTDAGGLSYEDELTVTVADVAPEAGVNLYEFDSKLGSGSSVSYTGQIARHALSAEIKNYIGQLTGDFVTTNSLTGDAVKAQLMALWGDYEAIKDGSLNFADGIETKQNSFAQISSSGKELSGKVAGADAAKMHKDWLAAGSFVGWSEFGAEAATPEGLVFHYFDLLAANIDKYNAGELLVDPAGNQITKLYITETGLDLNQLIQKHTLGALMFSQGTDDYLDEGLTTDNIVAQKDGGLYTTLEHQFDEGFGYFGAARNYLEYSDDEIAGKGGRDGFANGYNDYDSNGQIDLAAEYNWGNSTNAAKRDRGATVTTDFTAAAMNAFIAGRKIINDNVGSELSDAQMDELLAHRDIAVANWEKAVAATVVHYINDTMADLDEISDGDYSADNFADLAKHFGEMKGFALNFQFSPFSPFNDDANAGKFAELHALFGDAPVTGDADAIAAYKADLETARDLMQQVYGFNAENVANW